MKTRFLKVARLLYGEFCKVYGTLISFDVAKEFLDQVDDLREVNEKYVDYLLDYALDNNLLGV